MPPAPTDNSTLLEFEEKFSRFLSERGLRLTAERRRLLRILIESGRQIDADTLVSESRNHGAPISRATVYRTLELMVKCGLVRHAGTTEKPGGYEIVADSAPTVRLVCLGCGQMIEVSSNDIREERDRLSEKFGFQPQHHHLEVFGRCQNCRTSDVNGTSSRRSKKTAEKD